MNCTTVFIYFFLLSSDVFIVTASTIVSRFSKDQKKKPNTIFSNFLFLAVWNACHVDKHLREMFWVQRTFNWSHTAFKRTFKTACIVKLLILKLHNLTLTIFFISSFFFPVGSESFRSSAVNVSDWCWIIAKACFSWHPCLLICSVFTASPLKTFDKLYIECVLFFIVCHLIPSAACRYHVLCRRRHKSISGFLSCVYFC